MKEIKVLKDLIKAQDTMILYYRIGKSRIPEWVFDAFDAAKEFYGVDTIAEIWKQK